MKKKAIFCLTAMILFSGQIKATDLSRTTRPAVSGKELLFPEDVEFTVGLVLKKTGFWDNATPYRKAVKYLPTAAHCGKTNEVARVQGTVIGKVV